MKKFSSAEGVGWREWGRRQEMSKMLIRRTDASRAFDYLFTMKQVVRADVPDMPDRIVAATAVYFGVPVISRDGKIRASNVQSIW